MGRLLILDKGPNADRLNDRQTGDQDHGGEQTSPR
jgi:hypothetical protein